MDSRRRSLRVEDADDAVRLCCVLLFRCACFQGRVLFRSDVRRKEKVT